MADATQKAFAITIYTIIKHTAHAENMHQIKVLADARWRIPFYHNQDHCQKQCIVHPAHAENMHQAVADARRGGKFFLSQNHCQGHLESACVGIMVWVTRNIYRKLFAIT